jgi:fatty-acyl-CoA synthase
MIGQHLAAVAARHATATAQVYGCRRYSYAALNDRACRAAHWLRRLGVKPQDRVAVLLRNCAAFVELFFATAKLGAVFVPYNFRLTAREIALLMDASGPHVLIAGHEFRDTLQALRQRETFPREVVYTDDAAPAPGAAACRDSYELGLEEVPASEPDIAVAFDHPHMLLFSSGTTGLPKGAIYTHGTTIASSMAKIIDFRLTPGDSTVVFGPLFHAGPLMDLAVPLLLLGGKVVIGASGQFDAQRLLAAVAAERASVVPVYAGLLRRLLAVQDASSYDLASLRLMVTGGESVPSPVLLALCERFAGVGIVNNYGSTEGGPITAFLPPEQLRQKPGCVGKPAYGVQLRIVDPEGAELPPGQVGELLVRSAFVCRGYWKRPDLSAASPRGGWWHTGDLAWRDSDGDLWIAGRLKEMIKTGGEQVYPIEVERVIAMLEDVVDTAVVGLPDEEWGEAVTAFVVKAPASGLDAAAVLAHCRRHLAGFKKPRRVLFIDALPRTATNKVSRAALRAFAVEASAPASVAQKELA